MPERRDRDSDNQNDETMLMIVAATFLSWFNTAGGRGGGDGLNELAGNDQRFPPEEIYDLEAQVAPLPTDAAKNQKNKQIIVSHERPAEKPYRPTSQLQRFPSESPGARSYSSSTRTPPFASSSASYNPRLSNSFNSSSSSGYNFNSGNELVVSHQPSFTDSAPQPPTPPSTPTPKDASVRLRKNYLQQIEESQSKKTNTALPIINPKSTTINTTSATSTAMTVGHVTEQTARHPFVEILLKQELAKHVAALAIPLGLAIVTIFYNDPGAVNWFLCVVVSLLSVGVAALWNGNLYYARNPRIGVRVMLLGYIFIFGDFFGLMAYFLWPGFSAVVPIFMFLVTFLFLVTVLFDSGSPGPGN